MNCIDFLLGIMTGFFACIALMVIMIILTKKDPENDISDFKGI